MADQRPIIPDGQDSDLVLAGQDLTELVRLAARSLEEQSLESAQVERFLRDITEVCSRLRDRIEATTVAKVGLESILSAYQTRYSREAERMDDVVRFKAILAEKEGQLKSLTREMAVQERRVKEYTENLGRGQARVRASLERLDQALNQVRDAQRGSFQRLALDQAKVESVLDRFWPSGEEGSPPQARINLPAGTLLSVVDQVISRVAANEPDQGELIGQVLSSIKDNDLRRILSRKANAPEEEEAGSGD